MSTHLLDRTLVDTDKKRKLAISQTATRADLPISVVIVSYNSRELLRACLTSIELEEPSEIVVIDNVSSDASAEMVRQDFPKVRLMKSEKNNGYGAAANRAIASCSSKYVLLLNCDTLLSPGSLQALSDYLDQHPQVAIVGPSLVNPDGTPQPSCFRFPTPFQTFLNETSLSQIRIGNLSNGSPRVAQAVPWVLGAALAIRRLAFESLGGFDSSFFMYFEEVDLCYRLNKAGWQTHFTPAAIVTHVGGASTKQQRSRMVLQLYKSLCHFYQLHYSRLQGFQLKLVLTYVLLRKIGRENLKTIRKTYSADDRHLTEDVLVWRSILSNLWSTNGWLKR